MIELSRDEKELRRAAQDFARGEFYKYALEADRTETFDRQLWEQAAELGFLGLHMPEEYGGAGMGFVGLSIVCEEFWRVDPGLGQAILSTTFGTEMIWLFGTEEQKQTYIPPVCEGELVSATAITEPGAGSDVTSMACTAVDDGDEWVINGAKMFITNGTLADFVVTMVVTDPDAPDPHNKLSAIIVPTASPGFSATKLRGKMGIRASDTAELSYKDVRVPKENLIGVQGQGFHQLMSFFDRTRIHIGAQGVGLAQGCLDRSLAHVKSRKQFGRRLSDFQATQFKLAEMVTKIETCRSMVYRVARMVDSGKLDTALVAMAKWYPGRVAVEVADEAVQLHGGYGYLDEMDVQRFYRDAKILELYEGTREVEKMIIAKQLIKGRVSDWC